MDNQSIAPSMNPSQGGHQLHGAGHSQGETNVPRHNDIKDISSPATIDMQDPRIWNQFPVWERAKLKCNPFAQKVDGLKKIKDQDHLFDFKEMYPGAGSYGLKLGVK